MSLTYPSRLIKFFSIFGKSLFDFYRDGYFFLSAAVSFYTILAVPPLLVVIASIASFIPIEHIDWVKLIHVAIPTLLLDQLSIIEFLTLNRGAYGVTGFAVAYIISLGLFRALDQALYTIYQHPPRSYLGEYIWLQVIVFPIFILGLIATYGIATSLSEIFRSLIFHPFFSHGIAYYLLSIFQKITSIFGIVSIFSFLFTVYHFLTPRTDKRLKYTLISSILVTGLFIIIRKGFGFYFTYVSAAGSIYGAFSSIFGVLLWILIGYSVIFFGARFLYYLEPK